MTEIFKLLRGICALSLWIVRLLAAVQTPSAQDKSTTAQAAEQIAPPIRKTYGNRAIPFHLLPKKS